MATLINCTIENYIEKQYVGEQNIENAYIGSSEKAAQGSLPEHDLKIANLAKYIPLPERVEDIARQLATVKSAEGFKMVVSQIKDMYTCENVGIIVTKEFREALMPFITEWHPSEDTAYRHCKAVYSM